MGLDYLVALQKIEVEFVPSRPFIRGLRCSVLRFHNHFKGFPHKHRVTGTECVCAIISAHPAFGFGTVNVIRVPFALGNVCKGPFRFTGTCTHFIFVQCRQHQHFGQLGAVHFGVRVETAVRASAENTPFMQDIGGFRNKPICVGSFAGRNRRDRKQSEHESAKYLLENFHRSLVSP